MLLGAALCCTALRYAALCRTAPCCCAAPLCTATCCTVFGSGSGFSDCGGGDGDWGNGGDGGGKGGEGGGGDGGGGGGGDCSCGGKGSCGCCIVLPCAALTRNLLHCATLHCPAPLRPAPCCTVQRCAVLCCTGGTSGSSEQGSELSPWPRSGPRLWPAVPRLGPGPGLGAEPRSGPKPLR